MQASLESAPFMFHYVITDGSQASGVCFLTLTDKVGSRMRPSPWLWASLYRRVIKQSSFRIFLK